MVYRPPDAAQAFSKPSNLRFSSRSPADFFMFNGHTGIFYVIECKSFLGSCSFESAKGEKGIIHWHQREALKKFDQYKNTRSGFLLDFRKTGFTYFLPIKDFEQMVSKIGKKSFSESDMITWCSPILIDKKKLKVNYRYDVEKFLVDTGGKNVLI